MRQQHKQQRVERLHAWASRNKFEATKGAEIRAHILDNKESLRSAELNSFHWGATHFPSLSPFIDEIRMGRVYFIPFAQLTAQEDWYANGTSASPLEEGVWGALLHHRSLQNNAASPDHQDGLQMRRAPAHTWELTNPPTVPQAGSHAKPAARAAAPQQHSSPHSNQSEHLDTILECK